MSAAAFKPRADRVAEAAAALGAVDLAKVYAAPVLLLSIDGPPTAIVGLHAGGRHFCLSIDETRALADALRARTAFTADMADLIEGLHATIGVLELMLIGERLRSAREAAWWAAQ